MAIVRRPRRVILVGFESEIVGRIEGIRSRERGAASRVIRFRVASPDWVAFESRPGTLRVTGATAEAREVISVTFSPLESTVLAPVASRQCLIVASIMSTYGGQATLDDIYIHSMARNPTDVGVPFWVANHRIAAHPCSIPDSQQVGDESWVAMSMPCADMPNTVDEARIALATRIAVCQKLRGYQSGFPE